MDQSIEKAQMSVFETASDILTNGIEVAGHVRTLNPR